jgi:hypothetical protein
VCSSWQGLEASDTFRPHGFLTSNPVPPEVPQPESEPVPVQAPTQVLGAPSEVQEREDLSKMGQHAKSNGAVTRKTGSVVSLADDVTGSVATLPGSVATLPGDVVG